MTATIKLSNGESAIVDKDDLDKLSKFRWHMNASGYAIHTYSKNGKFGSILMHRLINNTPPGFMTDHINRNRLDNRKCNLRNSNAKDNWENSDRVSNTGIRGIHFRKNENKYLTYINHGGKRIYIGSYSNIETAKKITKSINTSKITPNIIRQYLLFAKLIRIKQEEQTTIDSLLSTVETILPELMKAIDELKK